MYKQYLIRALVISQPAALAATLASTNVTCNGANDGTITISGATGGYGTYEYSINGDHMAGQRFIRQALPTGPIV